MTGEKSVRSGAGITAWGSYDLSKPRVRLLLDRLRDENALRGEINLPVWSDVRDKAVMGKRRMAWTLLRLIAGYPVALARLVGQPSGGNLLLGYPAIPDIFLAWPVARLRRHRIIFDAFIPFHDTIVEDRKMIARGSLAARTLWLVEKLALRLADVILVDTDEHGRFLADEFGIDPGRFQSIAVGAEPAFWDRAPNPTPMPAAVRSRPGESVVLFYGQLIPLHGIATILEAARLTASEPIQWLIVGSGQEESLIRGFLQKEPASNVTWIEWVDYGDLPGLVARAAVTLGIFGTSDKAARVIPNKVFQVMAAGRPVITRASPAIDRLAEEFPGSLATVPAGDAAALAEAVRNALAGRLGFAPVPHRGRDELGPAAGVAALLDRLGAAEGATVSLPREGGEGEAERSD